jgi:hypothetical protein
MTTHLPPPSCKRCGQPIKIGQQRREYGRLWRGGLAVAVIKRMTPICPACVSLYLDGRDKAKRAPVNAQCEARFYADVVRHLPKATGPMQTGKVYVIAHLHDPWCKIYENGECNCDFDVEVGEVP